MSDEPFGRELPFEWLTAHDSGLLIRRIADRINDGTMPDSFWKKCYNMAGGAKNRAYGMDVFDDGFGIIGGSTTDFFRLTSSGSPTRANLCAPERLPYSATVDMCISAGGLSDFSSSRDGGGRN